jgi:2-iminobutanoate/2-iminopropanoate deaminase
MPAAEKRQFIATPGSFGDMPFSNAVVTSNTLYLSGHIGFEAGSMKVPEDPEREAQLLLEGIRDTLTRANFTLQDVVSLTIYCSDLSLFAAFNKVYRTFFRSPFPARAFIGSGPLLMGARFEIQGIAVKETA